MIQTQIFQTPTGNTYQPADRIERSLARTGNILERGIREQYERDKEQQQQFMSLYSNIGEIEGMLQQNYAGMMQQAVDNTKRFMAEHYKKGGKATDPEFMMRLGEMTGRIRGGMANAENIKQQVKQMAEHVYRDPAVTDKMGAFNEIMAMATNPDVLISRNPIDFNSVVDKYVDPSLVLSEEWKSRPSRGEFSNRYIDSDGYEKEVSVIRNSFIGENPWNEDGSLNITVDPDYLQAAKDGKINPRALKIFKNIAEQKYGDLPYDAALGAAIRDGFSSVANVNYKSKVVRTPEQIRNENARFQKEMSIVDLNLKKLQEEADKGSKLQQEEQDYLDEYEKFRQSLIEGKKANLANYTGEKVKSADYAVRMGNSTVTQEVFDKIKSAVSSKENWLKLTPEQRKSIGKLLGVEFDTRFIWGELTQEGYDKVVEALNNTAIVPVVTYIERETTTDGKYNWTQRELPIGSEDEKQTAFTTLKKLNMSGKSFKQNVDVPTNTQSTPFKGVPEGGFN